MSDELQHIWSRVQAELAGAVDEPTYRIWLQPIQPLQATHEQLVLAATPAACGWVRERFGRLLQTSAAAVLGPGVLVDVIAVGEPIPSARPGPSAGAHAPESHVSAELLASPRLTFDQFVIGDSNRLAHAAALTVAEMPGQAYNPLFICGPPGVGKSHLLSSIGALLRGHNPELLVRNTTGEEFTNQFLTALTGGATDGFKARFRKIDVLLVDDVQFLERKARTEEEFFHTFNALHEAGAQIVLSSDRPPRDLQALEDRLRERFAAGLVADIQPPELPTRLAILRKRVHQDGIQLADEGVLELVASRVTSNVRTLEGALIRVVAYSSLTRRAIDCGLATDVLDGLYPTGEHAPRRRSIAEIQAAACEQFGLSADELLSSSRVARVAWPRQVAMYLARELTDESLPAIGRHFGGRDHTTVLHAWRRTEQRLAVDDSTRAAVSALRERLGEDQS